MSLFRENRVKTPTVLQMEALECGAASLGMILGYYGKFIPLEYLRVECGVSRDGTKASNILKAARKQGLECKGFSMGIDSLSTVKLPVIIFWNFNHFVVLEGIGKNKFYINDPALGRRVVEAEEFSDSFTGVVLTFEKGPEFQKSGQKPSIIPKVKRRLVGLGKVLFFLAILSLLLFVLGFVTPGFSRFFIDDILIGQNTRLLKPLLSIMALTAVLNMVLSALQQNILLKFQMKLCLTSSAKFVEHIFRMPIQFFIQRIPGELCSRIGSATTIATLLSGQMITIVVNMVSAIFFLVLLLIYDVPLTLVSIALVSVIAIMYRISSEKVRNKSFKIEMESGKLSGMTMSGIEMIESLKASGNENDFFQQWSGQQAKVIQETQNLSMANTMNSIGPNVISSILSILVLTIGSLHVMDGKMTVGMLMAYQQLLSNFTGPIFSFVGIGRQLLEADADMQRIDDVMDYPVPKVFKTDFETESVQEKEYKPFKKLEGRVTLKNITFGYSPLAKPLIEGLDLELTPGKRIALVGGSGSGKSTIGKLLCGMYTPWSGELLFDGKPMNEIERNVFASSVAVVDQSISLFDGTIKDNLTMWNPTIQEETYIQAAKDACIHDVIASRPDGYFSKVIEGGNNFSGGQRQRMEIARALANNPRVLIMDEATSALDAITEMNVDANIRRRGCTSIIIAHRLSTIRDSDEIIVLDSGKIVQRGTHDELIKQEGLYQTLVKTM